jgi:hypothetical protein
MAKRVLLSSIRKTKEIGTWQNPMDFFLKLPKLFDFSIFFLAFLDATNQNRKKTDFMASEVSPSANQLPDKI